MRALAPEIRGVISIEVRELPTIAEPVPVLHLSAGEIEQLSEEIRALASKRDAVILSHNYQVPEIQEVADFVGTR